MKVEPEFLLRWNLFYWEKWEREREKSKKKKKKVKLFQDILKSMDWTALRYTAGMIVRSDNLL